MTVSRKMRGGSQYLELQKISAESGRAMSELLQVHGLESFIERLSRSRHASNFVLKGGLLLPAYVARRPTRDVDLQARSRVTFDDVVDQFSEILQIDADDGTTFAHEVLGFRDIRENDLYAGMRLTVGATVATAKLRFHIDLSFGDPITPAPRLVTLARLIGRKIRVLGYPPEMVLAEKIVTALEFGTLNTRWRDFVDVVGIAHRFEVGGDTLINSLTEVARFRGVQLVSLKETLAGFELVAQPHWTRWRKKYDVAEQVNEEFEKLLEEFLDFAEPVVTGRVATHRWLPLARLWQPIDVSAGKIDR